MIEVPMFVWGITLIVFGINVFVLTTQIIKWMSGGQKPGGPIEMTLYRASTDPHLRAFFANEDIKAGEMVLIDTKNNLLTPCRNGSEKEEVGNVGKG